MLCVIRGSLNPQLVEVSLGPATMGGRERLGPV